MLAGLYTDGEHWFEASEHFDIVIVDAPPTLGLADAPLLGAITGNILFVVEAGKTRTTAAIEDSGTRRRADDLIAAEHER